MGSDHHVKIIDYGIYEGRATKWRFECSCGAKCTARRTIDAALEAAVHHKIKVELKRRANGLA